MRDWKLIRKSAGPYPLGAYAFVQEGLRHTANTGRRRESASSDEGRHISGHELCQGLRDYAIQQFGLLARDVLSHWRVGSTEDFGRIVFAMVDAGMLRTSDEDSLNDFTAVYEFDEVFDRLELHPPLQDA